ncbi:hypothetical protein JXA02_03150 [candidate division KSB1 bacterium]|nr:hypothetical protein [candidate division KSB1 bacterium]RQW09779.1 MAG: hypothetical protein EH222_03495 [candidate division KSB1 bacterium]
MKCHNCGDELVLEPGRKIFRQDTCLVCGAYLRCCLNCQLYDPLAWKECHEPQAERVNDKALANFCEYFTPAAANKVTGTGRATDARQKLADLFKKAQPEE